MTWTAVLILRSSVSPLSISPPASNHPLEKNSPSEETQLHLPLGGNHSSQENHTAINNSTREDNSTQKHNSSIKDTSATMTKEKVELSAIIGIRSQEHIRILDAIDRMRDLGVNEDLSIPQVSATSYNLRIDTELSRSWLWVTSLAESHPPCRLSRNSPSPSTVNSVLVSQRKLSFVARPSPLSKCQSFLPRVQMKRRRSISRVSHVLLRKMNLTVMLLRKSLMRSVE